MTALYEGQLDLVMAVWYDNIEDQFKPYEDAGTVHRVGVNTPDSGQGFCVDGPLFFNFKKNKPESLIELFSDLKWLDDWPRWMDMPLQNWTNGPMIVFAHWSEPMAGCSMPLMRDC